MIATTLVQSRHLLELGLDPNTADCNWNTTFGDWSLCIGKNKLPHAVPAWSLSELLELMPMINDGWPVCCKIYNSEKWHVLYYSTAVTSKIDSGEYDTPIEAAYEMVCWLLEQGLIEKGG